METYSTFFRNINIAYVGEFPAGYLGPEDIPQQILFCHKDDSRIESMKCITSPICLSTPSENLFVYFIMFDNIQKNGIDSFLSDYEVIEKNLDQRKGSFSADYPVGIYQIDRPIKDSVTLSGLCEYMDFFCSPAKSEMFFKSNGTINLVNEEKHRFYKNPFNRLRNMLFIPAELTELHFDYVVEGVKERMGLNLPVVTPIGFLD